MSVLLLGLVATAAACGSVTEPDARLQVVVTNASGRPLRISGGAPTFIEVQDADGRVVAFGRFQLLALIALLPVTLAPGAYAYSAPVTVDLVAP